jgi:hypothetical protein
MTIFRVFCSTLLFLALTVPPQTIRADDECATDEEEKNTQADVADTLKAEKAGKQAELFIAYQAIANHYCAHTFDKNGKDLQARAKANLPKLGRDLAKAAEAKGLLYSKEPLRADGQTSAFRYYEEIGDNAAADRVMLKAARAKSEDLEFFKTAWGKAENRSGPRDPRTGESKPYVPPPAYRQELQKIASANADRFMKAEEKDAAGLSGSAGAVGIATENSLDKLRKAAEWMKFLPGGDKPARERAEQRGDTIMKRSDPTFTAMNAMGYYEFAGTSKAKEKLAQLEKKSEASQRALEKSSKQVDASFTEKGAAEQKKFEKGKADLEKELGF